MTLSSVRQGEKPGDRDMSVWPELGVVDMLVCRGDMLVVPSAELGKDVGDTRTWLADIAHDGHYGEDAMKRYPGMDKMIERRASAPFNGKKQHELQRYFAWAGIKH